MQKRKRQRWLRHRDLPPGQLRCSKCEAIKPEDEFYRDRTSRTGRVAYCKVCRYVASTAEQRAARSRKHRLWRLFGLTLEEYEAKLAAQNGVCWICERPETGTSGVKRTPRRMAIDHDHETGKVRDLLCHPCNAVLGLLDEDPQRAMRVAEYLRKWEVSR